MNEMKPNKIGIDQLQTDRAINRTGDPLRAEHLSDAGSNEFVRIGNGISADATMKPMVQGRNDNTAQPALMLLASVDQDCTLNNTIPVMTFAARHGNSSVAHRPLFRWENYNTSLMQMDANGNLGIGTATPSGKLHVAGTAFVNTFGGGLANVVGFNTSTKQLIDLGASNSHFKENIDNLSFDKDAFLSLRPVGFDWKPIYGGGVDVGFVAEEVAQVFPALSDMRYKHTYLTDGSVLRDSLGLAVVDSNVTEPYGVRYHKLSIYLFALVKQQDSILQSVLPRLATMEEALSQCCAYQPQFRTDRNSSEESGRDNSQEYILLRNDPNPFMDYTDIQYDKSDNCENCEILITDMSGRIVKRIPINGSKGQLRIYSSQIGTGIYTYSILEDGVILKTNKMVSSR